MASCIVVVISLLLVKNCSTIMLFKKRNKLHLQNYLQNDIFNSLIYFERNTFGCYSRRMLDSTKTRAHQSYILKLRY